MKRILPFVIAALLIPGVALAKSNPDKGTHQNHGKAKVQYILKGQLSAYGLRLRSGYFRRVTVRLVPLRRPG